MTAKAPRFTQAEFASLRRQLAPARLPDLIARIEKQYRVALGLSTLDDDSIAVLDLGHPKLTENESAGISVVYCCVKLREQIAQYGTVSEAGLDKLGWAIAEADPDRLLGIEQRKRSKTGGDKTGTRKRAKARERDTKIQREADAIRAIEPDIKQEALAAVLAERGYGAKETLLRKLARRRA